jgi:hypothetical protein
LKIATWVFTVHDDYVDWSITDEEKSANPGASIEGTTQGTLAPAIFAAYDAAGLVCPFTWDAGLRTLSEGGEVLFE